MFKKTKKSEATLFESPSMLQTGRALKKYDDPKAWHNQFYENVTSNIKEETFAPLYVDSNMGRSNASIRQLVAIMIMKEGNRRSDEQMFEAVDFDLLVRKALGLLNISEKAPSLDTYYLFRRRIAEYELKTGKNLLNECFKDVTKAQAITFNVEGKSIRMDSKLIGNNIAKYSRYRLILGTLQQWAKAGFEKLNHKLRKRLTPYLNEDAQKTEYRSTIDEVQKRLKTVGVLIYDILRYTKDKESTLYRVFYEQYKFVEGKAELRDKTEISAKSVQNHNDPNAHYREKGDQQVKGFSVNATETNDEDGSPSLITDVQVKPASAADKDFLQPAVEATAEITGKLPEHINADGAYQSEDNRNFAQDNLIDFVTTGLQGKPSRYDLSMEGDTLIVTDKSTEMKIPATKVKDKWRITTEGKAKYRYITQEEIEKARLRMKLESIPKKELDRRNNVEAAMFQISFHTRNNKTRYCGLSKHIMWACSRCMWINFIRLINYQTKAFQRTLFWAFSSLFRGLWGIFRPLSEICRPTSYIFVRQAEAAYKPLFSLTHSEINTF